MEPDFIDIEILKWEKYNPRTDAKSHSWFRFEHTLIESPPFYKWPGDHIKVLVYVLSQASKKKSRFVRIDLEHPIGAIRVSSHDVREAIQKMVFAETIRIVSGELRESNSEVTSSQAVPTYERTNGTDEQNPAPLAPGLLEAAKELVKAAKSTTEPRTVAVSSKNLPSQAVPGALAGQMESLTQVWAETLRVMKVPRDVREREREKIARMIQAHGADAVKYALVGPREEKASDTFDPKQHVSLDRVFLTKNVERFINLGATHLGKRAQAAKPNTLASGPDLNPAVDPKAVAAMLGKFSKHAKPGVAG